MFYIYDTLISNLESQFIFNHQLQCQIFKNVYPVDNITLIYSPFNFKNSNMAGC
jgi:hypothetical protein